MKTKKCAICGYEFSFEDKFFEHPFVQPHGEGAQYYYDLWHFDIEGCPKCGYASKDVSHTFNKKIIQDDQYNSIDNIEIIRELDAARPNRVSKFLKGAHYYKSIGDKLNEIKCLLQAGDLVFAELMYWEDYIFDDSSSVSSLIGKSQSEEIEKFADHLINSGVKKLEDYIAQNSDDFDAQIILAGTLGDGDKLQTIKSAKILSNLKTKNLTLAQKKAVKFLLEQMN